MSKRNNTTNTTVGGHPIKIILNNPIIQIVQNPLSEPQSPTTQTRTKRRRPTKRKTTLKKLSFARKTKTTGLAVLLYRLNGFDKESAVSVERLENARESTANFKIVANPNSSHLELMKSVKNAFAKLIKGGFVKEDAKGYYLTPKGKSEAETVLKRWEEQQDKKISPFMGSATGHKDEFMDSDDDDDDSSSDNDDNNVNMNDDKKDITNNDDDEEEDEEEEEEEFDDKTKNGLYLLTLYFLRCEHKDRLSFVKEEIKGMIQKVLSDYPQIPFVADEKTLEQNIADKHVINNAGKYSLTEEGANRAYEIISKRTEKRSIIESPKKRPRPQKTEGESPKKRPRY